MDEYISREVLITFLENSRDDKDWLVNQYNADWIYSWIESQSAADVIEVGSCEGCCWKGKGRFQKCTYCRRNRNLKDRYLEEGAFDE